MNNPEFAKEYLKCLEEENIYLVGVLSDIGIVIDKYRRVNDQEG